VDTVVRGVECVSLRANGTPRYNKLRRACQWRDPAAMFKTSLFSALVGSMKHFWALNNRLVSSWFDVVETNTAAMATISARLPMIAAAATGFGNRDSRRETQSMVTEKLLAASEGAHAGALETAKVALKVMTGQTHPVEVAGHMMDMAAAATGPARRKVKANARRLMAR
jgi:hypothetical protein